MWALEKVKHQAMRTKNHRTEGLSKKGDTCDLGKEVRQAVGINEGSHPLFSAEKPLEVARAVGSHSASAENQLGASSTALVAIHLGELPRGKH